MRGVGIANDRRRDWTVADADSDGAAAVPERAGAGSCRWRSPGGELADNAADHVEGPSDLAPDAIDGNDQDAQHEQVDHGLLPPLEAVRAEGDLVLEPLDAHPPAAASSVCISGELPETPRHVTDLVSKGREVRR